MFEQSREVDAAKAHVGIPAGYVFAGGADFVGSGCSKPLTYFVVGQFGAHAQEQRSGASGYWEAVLEVPAGEHRLCYIIEGRIRIPDPTILIREKDDFGGENSILAVNMKT